MSFLFGRKAELMFLKIVAPQVHGIDTEFCPTMISQMTFMFGIFLCSPIARILVQLFMGQYKSQDDGTSPKLPGICSLCYKETGWVGPHGT